MPKYLRQAEVCRIFAHQQKKKADYDSKHHNQESLSKDDSGLRCIEREETAANKEADGKG